MKPTSDELFKLIKSLTRSEKLAFKRNSSLDRGPTKYSTIFDAINTQEVYDEKALKEKFKNKPWGNRFNAAKNYLHSHLLDNLAQHNQNKDSSYELSLLIAKIKILQQKGFYDRCSKLIIKGKRLALEVNDNLKLLEIIDLESVNSPSGVNVENRESIHKQRLSILKSLENQYAYNQIYKEACECFIQIRSAGLEAELAQRFNHIMQNELIADISLATTFSARLQFLSIHYYYQGVSGNIDQMHHWISEIKTLFLSNPKIMKDHPVDFATAVLNAHELLIRKRDFTNASKNIALLMHSHNNKPLNSHQRLSYLLEYGAVHCEIEINNGLNEYGKSELLLPQLNLLFEKHEREISHNVRFRHLYLIAQTYFGLRDYKASLVFINKALKNPAELSGDYLIPNSWILFFMIHYELNNNDFLEHLYRQIKYQFSQRKAPFPEGKTLLKLLECSLNDFRDKNLVHSYLKALENENDRNLITVDYSTFLQWVLKKIKL